MARAMLHRKNLAPYSGERLSIPPVTLLIEKNLGKFDTKSDEGIFLGYSHSSRVYRVYNSQTNTVMESINVVIHNESSNVKIQPLESEVKPMEVEEPAVEELEEIVEFGSPESNDEPNSLKVLYKDTPSRLILNHPK
ncbi:uncharacterized protein LOC132167588 [Corylus avellana]|uniref:uncharacterized protein LOC132167588 n=1 Tax=Corylus avellana TaxID=13451 RepID=UPI00286AEC1F|nr:uncharacterized protein LOC132167588 [Corylus avellana]